MDMSGQVNYNNWTKTGLVQRVKELERELQAQAQAASAQSSLSSSSQPKSGSLVKEEDVSSKLDGEVTDVALASTPAKKPKGKQKIDPSRYSTRYIALKLAYLGKNYGGYEFQAMGNQPAIEEELWNALTKSCLIFPEDEKVVDFDCCEYSKCGRTDRGVSAFGQVIGLRVRSNRPLPKKTVRSNDGEEAVADPDGGASLAPTGAHETTEIDEKGEAEDTLPTKPFDPILDEIPYAHVLNRLLPKDIRILAWCPSPPPDFSARFSCRERQYRYFFTQPAFAPCPSQLESPPQQEGMKSGWLDIDAMRQAAKLYEGENDFRNLCKVDPAKQITNFKRRIFEADVVEVKDVASALPYLKTASGFTPQGFNDTEGVYPKVYCFTVRGSAFLWHQIRHMVSILFLVAQRLEAPSIVSELLDVEKNPCRPNYVMADEVPLVLWDCIFPADLNASGIEPRHKDTLDWIYIGDDGQTGRFGQFGIMDDAWQNWRGKKMDELLAGQLLQQISQQGSHNRIDAGNGAGSKLSTSTRVYEGGNGGRLSGKYINIMRLKMLQSAEEQNDKYARRKGFADAEDMRAQKLRNFKMEEAGNESTA